MTHPCKDAAAVADLPWSSLSLADWRLHLGSVRCVSIHIHDGPTVCGHQQRLTVAPDTGRASGSRRPRDDDTGAGKGAKRPKVEPKAEHGAGANGAIVPPPPQHLVQHRAQPVSDARFLCAPL